MSMKLSRISFGVIRLFIIMSMGMLISVAYGATENLAQLEQLAIHFVKQHITAFPNERVTVTVGQVDSRLKLAACTQKLTPFFPSNAEHSTVTTVGVSCRGDQPWTIYLPVKVVIMTPVVVSARNLVRGQTIQKNDLRLVDRNRHRLRRGYFTTTKPLVGQLVRRSIRAGTVLTHKAVKARPLVRRGQTVTIVAKNPAIHVEMQGTAKQAGALNEPIRVLNRSSRKVIEATVIAPGRVQVAM